MEQAEREIVREQGKKRNEKGALKIVKRELKVKIRREQGAYGTMSKGASLKEGANADLV